MINDGPYNLITKFLSGETNKEEEKALYTWRNESPENENFFQQCREAWKIITSADVAIPNKEVLWKRIESKIQKEKNAKGYSRSLLLRVTSIAATVALIIGASLSFFFAPNSEIPFSEFIVKTESGQKSETTLPDGTRVWLNSGSTIRCDFTKKERIVHMEGESYFDVAPNKHRPFKVQTKKILVECLGTEFNVKAYDDDEFVTVMLAEGSVRVNSDEISMLLSPNMYLTYDKNTQNMTHSMVDATDYALWRKNEIRYNNEKFTDIIKDLSRTYQTNIILESEQLKEKRFRGYVGNNNSSLKSILDILTTASMIMEYRIDNDSIVHIYDKAK